MLNLLWHVLYWLRMDSCFQRTAADSISAETIAQMEVQLEEIESALLCSRQSLETRTEELAVRVIFNKHVT